MTRRNKGVVGGVVLGVGAAYAYHLIDRRRTEPWRCPGGRARCYGARQGDLAGLDAASLPSEPAKSGGPPVMMRRAVGGALVLYGLVRRGRWGTAARRIGVGLLLRRPRLPRVFRRGRSEERRRIVDIQKTFHIDAPVDRVYAWWRQYDNFPRVISQVIEVQDLGAGRSRWRVRGPGGIPMRWQARLIEEVPSQALAWRSEPGAMLDHAGAVHFRPEGGATRVDLRFCYRPPARGAGRALAALLGADPRETMNDAVAHLKAMLEATVKSEG